MWLMVYDAALTIASNSGICVGILRRVTTASEPAIYRHQNHLWLLLDPNVEISVVSRVSASRPWDRYVEHPFYGLGTRFRLNEIIGSAGLEFSRFEGI